MDYRIVFPIPLLREILRAVAEEPESVLHCPVGVHVDGEAITYLARMSLFESRSAISRTPRI